MQNQTTSSPSEPSLETFWQHQGDGCEWGKIGRIGVGDIIRAPLKHPHHPNIHMRYYLVVSKDFCPLTEGQLYETLAVVSLETNGGHGRAAYQQPRRCYLKDIKLMGKASSAEVLEIRGWMPYDDRWRLLINTTVDLSTVLLVRSQVGQPLEHMLFYRDVGNLTTDSARKVAEFYKERMRHWTYAQDMTTRTRKVKPPPVDTSTESPASAPKPKGPPLPDNSSHVTVTIFDPRTDVHIYISDVKARAEAQKLDEQVGMPKGIPNFSAYLNSIQNSNARTRPTFSAYLDTIQDPVERHETLFQAVREARMEARKARLEAGLDSDSDVDLSPESEKFLRSTVQESTDA